jgi:hypothetical protein
MVGRDWRDRERRGAATKGEQKIPVMVEMFYILTAPRPVFWL